MIRRRCSQCGEYLSFSEHDPCDVCSVAKFDLQFIPAAAVRDALELYDSALSEAEVILGGEYGDYHAHLMEAVDQARTMGAALGLGANHLSTSAEQPKAS